METLLIIVGALLIALALWWGIVAALVNEKPGSILHRPQIDLRPEPQVLRALCHLAPLAYAEDGETAAEWRERVCGRVVKALQLEGIELEANSFRTYTSSGVEAFSCCTVDGIGLIPIFEIGNGEIEYYSGGSFRIGNGAAQTSCAMMLRDRESRNLEIAQDIVGNRSYIHQTAGDGNGLDI